MSQIVIHRPIRFFDKEGNDCNLASGLWSDTAWKTGLEVTFPFSDGTLHFDRTSVNLIDSQHLFLLQNVKGPTSEYSLRRIPGIVQVVGGSPNLTGVGTDFNLLPIGTEIKIQSNSYTVTSVLGETAMAISPTPATSLTTDDVYVYDYTTLDELRTTSGSFQEILKISVTTDSISTLEGFSGPTAAFFLYDVSYEDVPLISRSLEQQFVLNDGSSELIDPVSQLAINNNPLKIPTQINVGFSSHMEKVFAGNLQAVLEKQIVGEFLTAPVYSSTTTTFYVAGQTALDNSFYSTRFYLQGVTSSGATQAFYEKELHLTEAGVTGSDSYFVFDTTSVPNISSVYSGYRLLLKTDYLIADLSLYGETIGEDERLRLVLENFGRKIDFDKEYIFRDSDIHEELPDYILLNQKRKELLLQGDTIYPYIGSYKSLINVLDFFGYNDVTLKEYFLNVDQNSTNYGKFLSLEVPKNTDRREQVKKAWQLVPSKIYKKTSLFGLFYNLNEANGQVDEDGTPIVVDSFMFSPEEVLIKLFGLKELLKKQFLPLNARIYDITGEGIYFERVKVDTWTDDVQRISVNLGGVPDFTMLPEIGYVSDLRRLDPYYEAKFISQGLTGFLGATAFMQDLTAIGYTGSVSDLFGTYVGSYFNFPDSANVVQDDSWLLFPPGISVPNFNYLASLLKPLPDDVNIPIGAPVLLEVTFDISWEEADFTWADLSILDPLGNHLNVYVWTWESLGRGQNTDMRWVIKKSGPQSFFYDSDRKPIDDFAVTIDGLTRVIHSVALPYAGDYEVGLYLYDITNNVSIHYQKYTVHAKTADFIATYRKTTTDITWADMEQRGNTWQETSGPWWYPLVDDLKWEDADITWESLELNEMAQGDLLETYIGATFTQIDRRNQYVKLSGDFTSFSSLTAGNYLFFDREEDGHSNAMSAGNNSIGTQLPGLLSGLSGDQYVSTTLDLSNVLGIGDSFIADGFWYTVAATGPTSLGISEILCSTFSSVPSVYYELGGYTYLTYSSGATVSPWSNLLVVEGDFEYDDILPIDFYGYLNVVSQVSPTLLRVQSENESNLRGLIAKNWNISPLTGSNLSIFDGVFDGDYAIKISSVGLSGSDTLIRLNDSQNELYLLDGNFSLRASDFDVQAAYKHAGLTALQLENNEDVHWNEAANQTFFSQTYVPGALCGFVIPFVAPSSLIQIDEEPPFQLSGNLAIQSTKAGLKVAALEMQNANNSGLKKFTDWMVLPDDELYLFDSMGASLSVAATASLGATSVDLTGIPVNLMIPASISVVYTGATVMTISIDNPGLGYTVPPTIVVDRPRGGQAAIITTGISGGSLYNTVISFGGTGYTSAPLVTVDPPTGFKPADNYVFMSDGFYEIVGASGNTLLLAAPLFPNQIDAGTLPYLPYEYHKQQFLGYDLPHYFFIHARAANPSSENLSYVRFGGGMQGSWASHPTRSDSYPLKNSFLQVLQGDDQSQDYPFQFWLQNGGDYPPLDVPSVYSSPDRPDFASRAEYGHAIQQPYSYSDLRASKNQILVDKMTLVVFHFDPSRMPGKKNPTWRIYDETSSTVEVESISDKLMWNFTKKGNFTVSLKLEDANGNVSTAEKVSFVIVE